MAANARGEGSPLPNTACSINLHGRSDETTPHQSLCTGTGLTGPCRCYSEATCSNLHVSQHRPLLTVAQPLHDMAWDLDSLTHVGTLSCCDNLRIDFFGLCIILRQMSSVTSGMWTEGGLCFGAIAIEPIVCHFLTNAWMALFAGRPLPGNLLPKILWVSLIELIFMYTSTIVTLSGTKYVFFT